MPKIRLKLAPPSSLARSGSPPRTLWVTTSPRTVGRRFSSLGQPLTALRRRFSSSGQPWTRYCIQALLASPSLPGASHFTCKSKASEKVRTSSSSKYETAGMVKRRVSSRHTARQRRQSWARQSLVMQPAARTPPSLDRRLRRRQREEGGGGVQARRQLRLQVRQPLRAKKVKRVRDITLELLLVG